jgi:hypothetical protein
LAWPLLQKGAKAKCSTASFLKLFTFRERSRNADFSCYNVMRLSENCSPPPCLSLDIKDFLMEDRGVLIGWLWAACEAAAAAELY